MKSGNQFRVAYILSIDTGSLATRPSPDRTSALKSGLRHPDRHLCHEPVVLPSRAHRILLIWGGLFAAWAVLVVIDGEFQRGEFAGPMIRADSYPLGFWTVIAVALARAAFGFWRAFVEWRTRPDER